jgi:ankyrin repeat protein/protocatechuate 3,4-dioxygenase beta subunit
MKKIWQTLFILAGAALVCQVRAADGGDPTNYTGAVVDEKGQPVAGATVDYYQYRNPPIMMGREFREPEFKQRLVTDNQGAFIVPASRDTTLVVVKKTGLAPAWKTWPSDGDDPAEPLVLTVPTTLSGVVVDENDQPVAGAAVAVSTATVGNGSNGGTEQNDLFGSIARECFSAQTALDGSFHIENFPTDGRASFAVNKPGMAQRPTDGSYIGTSFQSGQEEIELKLGPAGAIEGKVVDQDTGQPVANVEVRLLPSDGNSTPHGPVRSGADGSFLITELQPAKYNVWAVLPDDLRTNSAIMRDYDLATVTAGETNRNVVIRTTAGVLVEVSVVSTNDLKPLSNVAVSCERLTAYTGDDGKAIFRVAPGKTWFDVSRPNWSPQVVNNIELGQTNHILIQMIPPPRISGIVRDPSGAPASGVRVSFHPGQYPMAPFSEETKTDEKGRYEMTIRQVSNRNFFWDGVINPTNFVMAQELKRNLAVVQEFGTDERTFNGLGIIPTNLDLMLQPGITLSGSVKDSGGAPVTNATVDISMLSGHSFARLWPRPFKVDAQGSFTIPALPQGREYYFFQGITAKGYGTAGGQLKAEDSKTNHYDFPAFVLERADRILAGQVLDEDGHPIAGADVRFNGKGQREWPNAKSDRHGYFVFDAVCDGEFSLSASAYVDGPPGEGVFVTSNGRSGVTAIGGDTNIIITLGDTSGRSRTPLHNAAQSGDLERVKELLKKNPGLVSSKGTNSYGSTPLQGGTALHLAARKGDMAMVTLLLASNADVNAVDNAGWTPLHEAAFGGNKEVVALLLAHGADVNAINNNAQTPLQWAITYHRSDVAQLLRQHGGLEHGYDVGHLNGTMTNWDVFAIQDAIQNNNLIQVKTLLKDNPSLVFSKDKESRTPLILSALAGHTDVTEFLLANKSEINAKDMFGRTPLHWAALLGHTNIALTLLENKANVNAKADGGVTPLHFAAQNGFKDVAELLVKFGADINATNKNGITPLHTVESIIQSNAGAAGTPAAKIYTARLQGRNDVAEWLRQHGGHE